MLDHRESQDIHELAIDTPADAPLLRRYERLKERWFDEEAGLWTMSGPGGLYYTHLQFIAAFFERLHRPEQTGAELERLRALPLYDTERRRWQVFAVKNPGTGEIGGGPLGGTTALPNLWAVFLESLISPVSAGERMDELRRPPYYLPERRLWSSIASDNIGWGSRNLHVETSLIGAIAESMIDRESGRERMRRVRECFQPRDAWMLLMTEDETKPYYTSADQLLAILHDVLHDAEAGRSSFARLRSSLFYDATDGHWRTKLEPDWHSSPSSVRIINPRPAAAAELLALVIETLLARDRQIGTVPLPRLLEIE